MHTTIRQCVPGHRSLADGYFVGAAAAPESIKIAVAGANNAGESTLMPGYGRHAGPVLIEAL